MDPVEDLKVMDNVLPNNLDISNYVQPGDGSNLNVSENVLVHYNSKQKWYYLSNHEPEELLVFRQVDSTGKSGKLLSGPCLESIDETITGVPHASFYQQPLEGSIPRQRESIEVRALVYFKG